MTLKETKFYFENLFSTLWTDTPIHYAGVNFDGAQQSKWINPVYKPMRSRNNGFSSNTFVALSQLYIVCWADHDIDAMELSDNVITFVNESVDKTQFKSRGYEIVDHGWDDSNKVFVMLSFSYEQLVGTC